MSRALRLIAISALLLAPVSSHANWTRVRDMVREADRITDPQQRVPLLRKAFAAAQESVRSAPRESNAYLWLANSAGRLAQAVRSKERIALAKVVKENAEKAIALDPNNGSAHMTLGAWHFYVADISWIERNAAKALYGELPSATYEKAVEHLSQALKHGVDNPIEVRWIRGRAYAALDEEAKSIADFRACLATPARNESEKRCQERARKNLD